MKPQTWTPPTLAAGALGWVAAPFGEVVAPIHVATTYERGMDGAYPGGRKYARDENPAFDQAEALLAALEGGEAALLFSSGLAAATAVFRALEHGDRILAPSRMYWGLRNWLLEFSARWGVVTQFYENDAAPADLDRLASAARPRVVWMETPANPTWDIQDIAETARIAHRHGALLAVDSTVATPVFTRPLELGADVVMHSATKYLNGHSDVVAGALVTRSRDAFWQRICMLRAMEGPILGPFEAWLLLRGMRTLYVRVPAAAASAMKIAQRYEGHPRLLQVLYPGLASHPGHPIAARQMRGGYGAMLSFRFRDGEAAAQRFLGALRVFKRATSLGSVESLVEHRASVEGMGSRCPPDLIRLSIGIENVEDLIGDIDQALGGAEEGT